LITQMAILVKCKEWIKTMMVMFVARLKWRFQLYFLDGTMFGTFVMLKWLLWFFVYNGSSYEIIWNGDIVHGFSRYSFVLGLSYYKICNIMMFCVNTCAIRMYYISAQAKEFDFNSNSSRYTWSSGG
jgi:hypothetical protein